jgi:hypothetical protein
VNVTVPVAVSAIVVSVGTIVGGQVAAMRGTGLAGWNVTPPQPIDLVEQLARAYVEGRIGIGELETTLDRVLRGRCGV